MKIKILICAFVLFTNAMQAQTTPEAFLAMAPSVPSNICSTKSDQKKTFLENNSVFADKLKVEIERRKKASKEYLDKNSGKIRAGTLKQAGFDSTAAKKMETMTEAERKAMASKMMKEKYNISMEDAQNLKNMTKEQRAAWVRTHSTQMMADAQANPQKYQANNNNAMEMIELNKQIMALNQSFTDKSKEFQSRYAKLEYDPEGVKLRNDIRARDSALMSMTGEVTKSEAAKMDKLGAEVKLLKKQYCSKFSPQFLAILSDYFAYIKKTMPDYYKFEELQEKQFQMQTGTQSPMGEKGLVGIQAIEGYSNMLKDAFKYDLSTRSESQ